MSETTRTNSPSLSLERKYQVFYGLAGQKYTKASVLKPEGPQVRKAALVPRPDDPCERPRGSPYDINLNQQRYARTDLIRPGACLSHLAKGNEEWSL